MDKLVEVVRIFGSGGMIPVGRHFLFLELQPAMAVKVPRPQANITAGLAILYYEMGAVCGQFSTDPDGLPSPSEGARLHAKGPAFRIELEDSEIKETPYSLSRLQPRFFRAFLALNGLLAAYRVSKFDIDPVLEAEGYHGPWGWIEPGKPDTFVEFLESSYAVLEVGGRRIVEASLAPKSYTSSSSDWDRLQTAIQRNIKSPLPVGRSLMLDAWIALYEGSVGSAMVLANTALEVEIRRILLGRLEPTCGHKAVKQLENLLRNTSFIDQLKTLLPLARVPVTLGESILKDCSDLRSERIQAVHKGKETRNWERAKQLLASAEDVFRWLSQQESTQA